MKKRVEVTVLIIALILCCLVPVIGATYGLFEKTLSTRNHLVAGSLKVTLVRQRLVSCNIDKSGNLVSVVDDVEKDFGIDTEENIFGIDATTLIVPGSSFSAEMKIGNNGDVAFYYYAEVYFNGAISDEKFASLLKVSVISASGVERETLIKDGLILGDDDSALGVVEVGSSQTFTIKLEFLDDRLDNDVQNKFVMFDLLIHAVQKVTA